MKSNLKCSQLSRLRTRVWLQFCMRITGLVAKEFQRIMVGVRGDPGVAVSRWLSGRQCVGPQTVEQVERHFKVEDGKRLRKDCREIERLGRQMGAPRENVLDLQRSLTNRATLEGAGSVELFFLPLWQLLDLKSLSEKKLFELCQPYFSGSPRDGVWISPYDFYTHDVSEGIRHCVTQAPVEDPPSWAIPNFGNGICRYDIMPVKPWNDSDQLYERGDVFGFIGILAALRHAAMNNDIQLAYHHCANAHLAVASLCRNEDFRPFWKRLSVSLYRLQKYLGLSDIAPCLSTIRKHINADQYLTSDKIVAKCTEKSKFSRIGAGMVSRSSTVVSAKKHQVVREAGRAGQYSRPPHMWALQTIERPADLP